MPSIGDNRRSAPIRSYSVWSLVVSRSYAQDLVVSIGSSILITAFRGVSISNVAIEDKPFCCLVALLGLKSAVRPKDD